MRGADSLRSFRRFDMKLHPLACLAVLAASMTLFAQEKARRPAPSQTPIPAYDRQFLEAMALSNQTEIRLAVMAQERAGSSWIREVGRTLEKDHRKAYAHLSAVAAKLGIGLPQSLSAKDQAVVDRLSRLKGKAFDKEFRAVMMDRHNASIRKLEEYQKRGSVRTLRAWAQSVLPHVQHHLKLLRTRKS
jgi:putative membrane protein